MLAVAKKLNEIVSGWTNYVWESNEIKKMARERAIQCADCDNAKRLPVLEFIEDDVKEIEAMACELCDCPLSALLRSPTSKCKANKWQAKA